MKSFLQYITEYYEQSGGEDPMTGRPKSVYKGDYTDLDPYELHQQHIEHRDEIEHHFGNTKGGFGAFEDHVHKGIRAGHDNDTIIDNHPISNAMNDPKHPDHHSLYRNDHHFDGYIDSTRELASRD